MDYRLRISVLERILRLRSSAAAADHVGLGLSHAARVKGAIESRVAEQLSLQRHLAPGVGQPHAEAEDGD